MIPRAACASNVTTVREPGDEAAARQWWQTTAADVCTSRAERNDKQCSSSVPSPGPRTTALAMHECGRSPPNECANVICSRAPPVRDQPQGERQAAGGSTLSLYRNVGESVTPENTITKPGGCRPHGHTCILRWYIHTSLMTLATRQYHIVLSALHTGESFTFATASNPRL